MNSNNVRSAFLNYFKKNGHKIVHSSPLVPQNDPTLMFANSGMVQFKNIFTGRESKQFDRATTSQKCVRAGGKHNDLENVGYTTRHHTFFEMLGNFSFGDYFKDLAIEFAWNLITKEFQINKDNLLVTVFSEDEDSYNLWKKIAGLSNDKIIKISTSDNFWSMGDTGPCGPCSEIFYDHGEKYTGGPPGSHNEDGDRFVEIWNLVFMQYEQISISERINLPKPSIDTGMGLERISSLLNNSNDNYSTDLFLPLINKSIELLNNEELNSSPSHRVIADHLRSSAFLIADGVLPSNEGRGYVLRRIMRRGMRHAHTLGNKDPIFNEIFPTLIENMSNSYPELLRAKDLISSTLLNEEVKFKETVEKGIRILEEEIKKTSNKLNGEVAFKLYDTYGFPLDLTQDYLKDKNIEIDISSFEKKMKEQKERARRYWKGTGDLEDNKIWFEITEKIENTEFLGYENYQSESIIKGIIKNNNIVNSLKLNQEAVIILNQSPFYGESGGQVGDIGIIKNDNFEFEVKNTTKIFGTHYLHIGKVTKGSCKLNDSVEATINVERRELIKCNHSSTHLLHAALRSVLGNHVTQKGSLVNDEKLRFDFSHNSPLTNDEILKIDNIINFQILNPSNVKTIILDQKKAIEEGAMALFGEKYNDEVRVVSMGQLKEEIFSKELCGGTHVNSTKEIKNFKIIHQSNVASGIRRIEAITNEKVNKYLNEEEKYNIETETKNNDEINQLVKKITKIDKNFDLKFKTDISTLQKLKELKNIYLNKLEKLNLSKNLEKIKVEKINNINLTYLVASNYPIKLLKQFIDDQKNKCNITNIIIIISENKNKLSIVLGSTEDLISKFDSSETIREISKILGGKGGGGRKDLAQAGGTDSTKIDSAINFLRNKILDLD